MPLHQERLTLTMSGMDMVVALSDGNPGAVTVLMEMISKGRVIDPQSAFGPFTGFLSLDTYGIYGSNIWLLYKDICGSDIFRTLGLLRACQMGIVDNRDVDSAIAACAGKPGTMMTPDRIDEALKALRSQLPSFGANVAEEVNNG